MKKFLLSLFLLFSLAVTAAAAGTDVLTNKSLNNGKNTNSGGYTTVNSTGFDSGAEYIANANFLLNKGYYYYDLNTSNYIATKVSGGRAVSVKITSTTQKVTTSAGRVVTVYGSHKQFTSKANGTEIGSWEKVANQNIATIDLTDKTYEYIVICVTGGAFHFEQIDIEWVAADKQDVTITNELITQTYNPNSPKVDLSQNLPADLLKDATLEFSGAVELNEDGSVAKTYIASDGTIKAANVTEKEVTVAWSGSASYKDSSHKFKFLIGKATPSVKYMNGEAEVTAFTATIGEKNDFPVAIVEPAGLKLRYSSSSRAIADIDDNTGAITLKKDGNATIGAFFDGDALFNDASATYTLTVNPEKALEAPTFSLVDGGSYDYGMELVISTTAADATLEYSTDAVNYLPYIGPITLDKAGEWTVFARVTKGSQTEEDGISFTVNKLKYTYEFGAVAEQMVGRDRYFAMPKLEGAEGVAVKYTIPADNGVLLSVPGEEGKYFITGAGDVIVTAEIAGNANYDDFTAETTVKVVPQITKIETANIFDYQNYKSIGLSDPTDGQYIYIADNEEIKVGNVVMTTVQGSGTTPSRIVVNNDASKTYFAIYRPTTANGKGGSMTFTASDIVKIEITFLNYPGVVVAETEGTFTDAVDNVRVWTPKEGSVNSATFYTTFSGDKDQKWNPQIAKVVVYTMTEGGEPAQPFNMAFSAEEYELEEGDMMPNVVLPDDFTGEVKYLVNGEPKNVGYRFPASEEAYEIIAYTEGDAKRLPAVDKTIVYAYGYELADVLAIHYSTENTPVHYSTVAYSAPKTIDGDVHRYEFTDIDVKGYDGVDGKTYGHVFFSFTPAPGEATALAPRREAAEGDWASFNANTDIYSAATHLTEAGENTPLVRHRAGTLGDAMPAVFRVQSSAETGQMYNFTVNLDKNGTSSVTAVQSQTQTGVESVGVDADGEAEYYTLQGVRVAKPAAGIYLRRQGGTVSKVLVK